MYGFAPISSRPIAALASGYSLGDPFRNAMRDRLGVILTELAIPWPLVDMDNAGNNPDVSASFVCLDFPGGSPEEQYTFGAPGANYWKETGQVSVYLKTRMGAGTTTQRVAEGYAAAIRRKFRANRIGMDGGYSIVITATAAMGGGHDEGGLWVESIGLEYRLFTSG
jgi:hypothetical protein